MDAFEHAVGIIPELSDAMSRDRLTCPKVPDPANTQSTENPGLCSVLQPSSRPGRTACHRYEFCSAIRPICSLPALDTPPSLTWHSSISSEVFGQSAGAVRRFGSTDPAIQDPAVFPGGIANAGTAAAGVGDGGMAAIRNADDNENIVVDRSRLRSTACYAALTKAAKDHPFFLETFLSSSTSHIPTSRRQLISAHIVTAEPGRQSAPLSCSNFSFSKSSVPSVFPVGGVKNAGPIASGGGDAAAEGSSSAYLLCKASSFKAWTSRLRSGAACGGLLELPRPELLPIAGLAGWGKVRNCRSAMSGQLQRPPPTSPSISKLHIHGISTQRHPEPDALSPSNSNSFYPAIIWARWHPTAALNLVLFDAKLRAVHEFKRNRGLNCFQRRATKVLYLALPTVDPPPVLFTHHSPAPSSQFLAMHPNPYLLHRPTTQHAGFGLPDHFDLGPAFTFVSSLCLGVGDRTATVPPPGVDLEDALLQVTCVPSGLGHLGWWAMQRQRR
ncbi:hypothetical protein CVT26_010447 [Gymnopilus dilepis]|uniref:Uncharacterized protein n=1 Tax=Gymnopilus dilepis TaxID=231916 RepID=A0A409Y0I0_9AGAR|nr:hypothetical protein CVT26_010447 [Gymnopilus dilepis]